MDNRGVGMNGYNSNPSATLCILAYGGVETETLMSILRDIRGWPNLSVMPSPNDALVCRARAQIASAFLKDESPEMGDVLLMVDHDIGWRPGDLSRIARKALERNAVVGGIYPKRVFGQGFPVAWSDQSAGDFTLGEDRLIPVRSVSTGFVAIPRKILKALSEKMPLVSVGGSFWPFFMPSLLEERQGQLEYLSEDWAFCSRVADAGFPILADTMPLLTHTGLHMFRGIDANTRLPEAKPVKFRLRMPVEALEGLRGDLMEFFGLDGREIDVLTYYGKENLAALWDENDPDWYLREDVGRAYAFDLGAWHTGSLGATMSDLALPLSGQRVLDYGAGIGTWSLMAASQNEVDAIEPNDLMAGFMQYRADKLGVKVRRVGKPEGRYGVVIAWHVLEHVDDAEQAAREIAEALEPGGILITDTPEGSHPNEPMHRDVDAKRIWQRLGFEQDGLYTWRKTYSRTLEPSVAALAAGD